VVPAPAPGEPLVIELAHGRDRRSVTVGETAISIGSTDAASVVIRAGFLLPIHAWIRREPSGWVLEPAGEGAMILAAGKRTTAVHLERGETYRLADQVGNFVTLRVSVGAQRRTRASALRAPLPAAGESFLVGSDPSCAVRLDHPLVQRRHAAVRRDGAGAIWIEDRGTAAGTYVNGQRLRGRTKLSVGDTLQIGPFSAAVGPSALEPLEQLPGVDIAVIDAGIDVAANGRRRVLLDPVSLHLEAASLTAVVGPSGAGKTTLMRMLSGQLAATRGDILYNGAELRQCRPAYAELMGFVPQDDVVHTDLTVREALTYQAQLRLGASAGAAEQRARVEHLITMLGLTTQSEQLVRTLSGGQRKRVSIACELLKEPQLIFLDEPTSGLDPGLDKRMMLLLRLLADQGRTVLLTTHAIAHVDVCDTLILVGPGGHVMYAGPPDGAAESFEVDGLGDVFSATDTPEVAAQAAAKRRAALGATTTPAVARPAAAIARPRPPQPGPAFGSTAWWAAALPHARIFAARHFKLLGRDRAALGFTLLQGVVVALLTALVAPRPLTWSTNGNTAMFVFGCAAVWFGMIGSVRELVKERPIWRREFMAGGNVVSYLGARVAVLAGVALVQALTLTLVLAVTLHLPHTHRIGPAVFGIVVTLWLATVCGQALGLLVSATSPTADRALSLVPYLLIAQLILCGVLFHLGAATFISWLMPARWAVSGLGGIAGLSASALQQSGGLYPHSAIGLLGCWVALLVITVAGIAGTAWSLVRHGRSWQIGSDSPPPLLATALQKTLGGPPQGGPTGAHAGRR
jgi:ABC-type multidrug transport system ATPase subunit/pSer/pThr/pTyr-binding forkhead associated (FHA) protein